MGLIASQSALNRLGRGQREDGFSPAGFVGNILENVGALGRGLTTIIGGGMRDVGRGIGEIATFGQGEFDYETDDIVKHIFGLGDAKSVVLEDLKTRWGPLFEGNFGEFGRQMYENPVFFASDITGAAGLTKMAAARVPGVREAAIAKGGTFLFPGPKTRVVGQKLEQVPGFQNPVTRAVVDKFGERFLSKPLHKVEAELGARRAALGQGDGPYFTREANDIVAEENILRQAKEAGLTSLEKPWVRDNWLRRATDKAYGIFRLAPYRKLAKAMKEFPEELVQRVGNEKMYWFMQGLSAPDEESAAAIHKLAGPPVYPDLDDAADRLVIESSIDDAGIAGLLDDQANPAVQAWLGPDRTTAELSAQRLRHVGKAARPVVERLKKFEETLATATKDSVRAKATSEIAAGKRLLRGLYENTKTGGKQLSDEAEALHALRLWVWKHQTVPLLESSTYTLGGILSRQYAGLRVRALKQYQQELLAKGVDEETARKMTHWDPDLKDFPHLKGTTPFELDDARMAAGLHQPIYVPWHNLKKGWLEGIAMQGDAVNLRVTKPGSRKRARGTTPENLLNTDLKDVMRRRTAEEIRYQETRDFLKALSTYGRPVSTIDELGENEVALIPDYIDNLINEKRAATDHALQLLDEGVEHDAIITRTLEEMLPRNAERVAAGMEAFLQQGGPAKMYAVPKVIAERVRAHLHVYLGKKTKMFWDTGTSAWRGFVLSGSPRWVLNNLIGNIFFLKLQGGKLTDVGRQIPGAVRAAFRGRGGRMVEGLDNTYWARVKRAIGDDVRERVEPGFYDVEAAGTVAAGQRGGAVMQRVRQNPVVKGPKSFGQFIRRVNSEMEDAFRRASYLTAAEKVLIRQQGRRAGRSFWKSKDRLEKAAEVGWSPELAQQAVDEVNRFLNDYQTMTPAGRAIVRRFIVPFFSFYRHMVKLQTMLPFEHAERFNVLRALSDVGHEIASEYGPLPAYAQGAYMVGPGERPGEDRFASARGANPFDDLDNPLSKFVLGAHPVARMAVEHTLGRNLFTNQPFSDKDVVTPFGSDRQFRIRKDEYGNAIGAEEVDRVAPSPWEHVLQQFPQYELMKDMVAGGRTYDTSSLGDLMKNILSLGEADSGVIMDPETGQARFPTSALGQLGRISGISTFPVQRQAYQERLEQDRQRALQAFERMQGGTLG